LFSLKILVRSAQIFANPCPTLKQYSIVALTGWRDFAPTPLWEQTSMSATVNAPAASLEEQVRPNWRLRLPGGFQRAVSPLLIVTLWQIASSLGWLPAHTLASPAAVLVSAWQLTLSGELPLDLLVSLGRVAAGVAIGIALGTSFALIAGLSRLGEAAVDGPLQMFRAVPFLALIPLFILWFGIGETPKIALVALAATFPIYLNLSGGIRGIDRKLLEAAHCFGLDHAAQIRHVILPGALPSFLIGLRYSIGVAWLSLVAAEQINATSGVGYLINNARDFLRTDVIVLGLAVYAILGLLTDVGVRWLETASLRWRPSHLVEKVKS
jgi:sulfonate transport system permease protein